MIFVSFLGSFCDFLKFFIVRSESKKKVGTKSEGKDGALSLTEGWRHVVTCVQPCSFRVSIKWADVMDRCQVNQDTGGLERTTCPETSIMRICIILRGTRVCIVLCNQVGIVCGLFI